MIHAHTERSKVTIPLYNWEKICEYLLVKKSEKIYNLIYFIAKTIIVNITKHVKYTECNTIKYIQLFTNVTYNCYTIHYTIAKEDRTGQPDLYTQMCKVTLNLYLIFLKVQAS